MCLVWNHYISLPELKQCPTTKNSPCLVRKWPLIVTEAPECETRNNYAFSDAGSFSYPASCPTKLSEEREALRSSTYFR